MIDNFWPKKHDLLYNNINILKLYYINIMNNKIFINIFFLIKNYILIKVT